MQGRPPQQKSYYKPHGLEPPPASTTPSVLANPWVRHFKQRASKHDEPSTCPTDVNATLVKEVESAVDVSPTNIENIENMIGATTIGKEVEEEEQSGASGGTDCKGTDNCCFEGSGVDQGLRSWQNRLQGGGPSGMIPSSRKDMASFALKRPSSFDIDNGTYLVSPDRTPVYEALLFLCPVS